MRVVFDSRSAESWFVLFVLFIGLPALTLLAREIVLVIGEFVRFVV
jgi:hypothetical protein